MIQVRNCSKTFRVHEKAPGLMGSLRSLFHRKWIEKRALVDVSLDVGEGEIVGLIGSNGAGKTTLIKILSGIIHPSAGQISVLGHNPWDRHNDFRSRIALIMGQKAQLWWDLPAADCFMLLREIYRIPKDTFQQRLDFLTSTLGVEEQMNIQIRRLSLGERMKMELVATLLHNPKVVYLDEPTIGLDITAQRAMRKFLLDYGAEHQPAMILTSHYMEDIRSLCKRIVILKKGEIVYDGALRHIIQDHNRYKMVVLQLAENQDATDALSQLPNGIDEATPEENGVLRLRVPRQQATDIAQFLLQRFEVADLAIEEEDISTIIESVQTER